MLKKIVSQVQVPHLRLRVKTFFQKAHAVGARPGSLSIGPDAVPPSMRVIQYDPSEISERALTGLEDVEALDVSSGMTWIDVQGLADESLLRGIAARFGIHRLALEDMVNAPQLPKIEQYDNGILWVSRMVRFDESGALDREQLGIYSTGRVVITFQERPGDVLEPVRERLRAGKGPIRGQGADYLAYALVDTVVDGYYPVVERVSRTLEDLDARAMEAAGPDFIVAVNDTKQLLTMLRRIVRAQLAAVTSLLDQPGGHISDEVVLYLRDVKDHTTQLGEVVDNLKELALGMLNTFLSIVSYRQNEVMKMLTIMASIFIPLTFVAGIYGMNFEHMPELSRVWAYPAALSVMVAVAIGMLVYFYRKGWLGGGRRRQHESQQSR